MSGCYGYGLTYSYNLYMLNSNQYTLFTNTSYYYTTGQSNSDLTILSDLFTDYPLQVIWKIELVVYISSRNVSGYSSILINVNFPPSSGSCNVNPTSGTTITLFTITCVGWIDPDGSLFSFAYYGKYF